VVQLLLKDPRINPEDAKIQYATPECCKLLFMDNRVNKVFPQYFVFCSGLSILVLEINQLIFKFMVLLRLYELNNVRMGDLFERIAEGKWKFVRKEISCVPEESLAFWRELFSRKRGEWIDASLTHDNIPNMGSRKI